MIKQYLIFTGALLMLLFGTTLRAQQLSYELQWSDIQEVKITDEYSLYQLYFEGASYGPETGEIPVFENRIRAGATDVKPIVTLNDLVFEDIRGDLTKVKAYEKISQQIEPRASLQLDRKQPYTVFSFVPVRYNNFTGTYEKLISFSVSIEYEPVPERQSASVKNYATTSVLSSGKWYKIAVQNTGIHRISYGKLQEMGLDPGSINPRNLRVYGNGGGMLSESLNDFAYDDLQENAIQVVGENDGSFDQDDYILFYAESPHSWKPDNTGKIFHHSYNLYSEYTYYFITTDKGAGKRIGTQQQATEPANQTVTTFTDFDFYEVDQFNLVRTGRVWYDTVFEVVTKRNYNFSFPNIVTSKQVYFKTDVAAKSSTTSYFHFYANGDEILQGSISGIPGTSDTYAKTYSGEAYFLPNSPDITIGVEFQKLSPSAIGWLNYLELNVVRQLSMSGGQMAFRDPESVGDGNISEFRLSGAPSTVEVWNVSDPLNIMKVATSQNGQQQRFRFNTSTLLEFIAHDGSTFYDVEFVEEVQNQNLHGVGMVDMVIVSHPDFLTEAGRLADYHRSTDGMDIYLTTPQEVYNEFSSGGQDITGIRNFMRMLYDRAARGSEPSYLLLFGDASYDYKDRVDNNSNYVPTWEDEESLTIVYSIATDDYYGFLDETSDADNLLDLGIGRFPVETIEQAKEAVDKTLLYASNSEEVLGDWRNSLCFVADDEDGNLHISQAEQMANYLDTTYNFFNVDKIYLDAFPQISTPGGQRAPDVNRAINDRIAKGTLLMNYTGHGGEVGWAHERVLEIADINSWTNYNMMPVFITATCEFSRYDDAERLSAGEMVFRNPNGGAVGMFTTARATFGGSNFNLNRAMLEVMFEKVDGEYLCFGDMIRLAKNTGGVGENDQKFILLGDPAMKLSFPPNRPGTTSINGKVVSVEADTLQALSKVTVTGVINDEQGNKLSNFNGTVFPMVLDKPTMITTLATDENSHPKTFEIQKNILYKGKAVITNGEFSYSFIVPKDIAYNYGYGKISYYASGNQADGTGYYRNIVVGGLDQDAEEDKHGPQINLYMNDENFAFGGITDEKPYILAYVEDESGINTVGSGIGHDIVATLDEDTGDPIVLNEYYEADLNSYKSGVIRYGLQDLENGRHTVSIKVWDVYNNSGVSYTEFVVAESAQLAIDNLLNYPNPFTTNTSFYFDHNQAGISMEVMVQIFTVSGKLIKTIDQMMMTNGYRSEAIPWDGRDDFGDRIGKGVYLYKLRVRTSNGEYAEQLEKLVILK